MVSRIMKKKQKAEISAQNTLISSNELRQIPPYIYHYGVPAFTNMIS